MDHISKALEKNRADNKQSGGAHRVRDWVRPDPAKTEFDQLPTDFREVKSDPESLRRNCVLGDLDDPVVLDRYRLLRTRTLQQLKLNNWVSVGVTSPGSKDGKTLTATNLAMAIARDGEHRVFLIDADLRRPSVADTLGLELEHGIVDFLRNDAKLEDIVIKLGISPRLMVVPGRQDFERPAESELLRSPRMGELFDQIRSIDRKAIVVVDFPPILVGDDVIALAPRLDSMLLIVSDGQTNVDNLTSAVELLSGYNLLGTVLNRCADNISASEGYYGYYQTSAEA